LLGEISRVLLLFVAMTLPGLLVVLAFGAVIHFQSPLRRSMRQG
jgi:hypothetical protein